MKPLKFLKGAGVALCALVAAAPAMAEECFIGEVQMFGGNFAPRGYAFAHGQVLSISDNTALFSIYGTTYGGDGRTTFNLPDLRGRVAIGAGNGPGLNPVSIGARGGSEFTQPQAAQAAAGSGASVGATTPISNVQPFTGINYIVCMFGYFPQRS